MSNRKQTTNSVLEEALYSAFMRKYAKEKDETISRITGVNRVSLNMLKNKRALFQFSRLNVVCKVFPELEELIIHALNDTNYTIENKRIEELSKQEKLELVIRILSTL